MTGPTCTAAHMKDDFYYAVEPFQLSGLDNLTASNFRLEGTLVSAGIVADINQPLVVMDDFYMGLTSITPRMDRRFTTAMRDSPPHCRWMAPA